MRSFRTDATVKDGELEIRLPARSRRLAGRWLRAGSLLWRFPNLGQWLVSIAVRPAFRRSDFERRRRLWRNRPDARCLGVDHCAALVEEIDAQIVGLGRLVTVLDRSRQRRRVRASG